MVSVTGIVLVVAAVVAASKGAIASSGVLIFLVAVVRNGLARLSGMSMAKRKAIAIGVGMQHSGLGAELATAHFSPVAAVPRAICSVWHNISGAILTNMMAKRN